MFSWQGEFDRAEWDNKIIEYFFHGRVSCGLLREKIINNIYFHGRVSFGRAEWDDKIINNRIFSRQGGKLSWQGELGLYPRSKK